MPSAEGALSPDAAFQLTARRADRCALFFDFDGTLAPIQDDPDSVQLTPGVLDALDALSRKVASVAIVSARPAGFLQERFGRLPHVALFGVYGLEVQRDNQPVETDPSALPFLDLMTELADRARAELPADALVEYKRLSVAVHYRTAPHVAPEVEQWGKERAGEFGLRLQTGRMVLELKPPGQRDKGSVLLEETEGLSCAWYFGDDVADLRAFAALDQREAADPDFTGIRVAVANTESGQQLVNAADLHVDTSADVPALLRRLVAEL